ncbi:MAG TPA: site-2 protease family protein [Anaerolineales bacterium]|jgi:Zn-dependent protease|nr:site-2 protease family protein [Anaerolineales bacterium]
MKFETFLVVLVGWVFSLCLHEFSHALVAYFGGDTTVKEKGYLTFNPLKYTHPVFSILLPLLFLMLGGIGLPGGAVYIETWRLRSRGWVSAVSLAGPTANLLLAILLGLLFRFAPVTSGGVWPGLAFLAFLQVSAVVLNLIPLPPFDGFGAIEPYLPDNIRTAVAQTRGMLPLVVFFLLWEVPAFYENFWAFVAFLAKSVGVPLPLVQLGFTLFRFWT